jgi:hypothetical protein
MDLHIIDEIPNRLLEVSPAELHQVLPGPTLLRIPGEKEPSLFICTLLHGDEPTGFLAVQQLLNHYRRQEKPLPRSVWLFLGNIAAARKNVRHLHGQPDFNRIEVPDNCRIGFGEACQETDFNFIENLESMNFVEQAENTLMGWRRNPDLKLAVVDEQGQDVSEGFISYTNGEIRLIRSVVPSMFTTFAPNVLDDCLGYLMQRYALE